MKTLLLSEFVFESAIIKEITATKSVKVKSGICEDWHKLSNAKYKIISHSYCISFIVPARDWSNRLNENMLHCKMRKIIQLIKIQENSF